MTSAAVVPTVLQLSDVHLARARGTADERLDAVLGAWRRVGWRASLVLLTGDNTDDDAAGAHARLAGALAPLGAPVLAIPGNHDSAASVASEFGDASTAAVGEWRVVGLDSARPGQVHGTIDVALALALIDGTAPHPTVVAVHHPPVSPSAHPWFQLEGAQALLDGLVTRPHVRAVVSGHLHHAFEQAGPGGVALLGCPSTLYAIAHHGDRWEPGAGPTGARVLRLGAGGELTWQLVVA